jgi:hypothetical protein
MVARQYLRSGFVFDIVPLLMLVLTSSVAYINYVPWIHYLILLKLSELVLINLRIRERLQLHRKSKAFYMMMVLVVELYFLIHAFAAIFYRTGVYMFQNPW